MTRRVRVTMPAPEIVDRAYLRYERWIYRVILILTIAVASAQLYHAFAGMRANNDARAAERRMPNPLPETCCAGDQGIGI